MNENCLKRCSLWLIAFFIPQLHICALYCYNFFSFLHRSREHLIASLGIHLEFPSCLLFFVSFTCWADLLIFPCILPTLHTRFTFECVENENGSASSCRSVQPVIAPLRGIWVKVTMQCNFSRFFFFIFFSLLLISGHLTSTGRTYSHVNRLSFFPSFDQRCHFRTDVYCGLPSWTQIARTNHKMCSKINFR